MCATCSNLEVNCFNGACSCDVCRFGCPYSTVQSAIDDPAGPTTVHICAGAYQEFITISRDVILIGAGDGGGSSDTILQGAPGNFKRVVAIPVGRTVTLTNLRIFRGNPGGGLSNAGATLLNGCTLSENGLDQRGAAILNSGSLTLDATKVFENSAVWGGGIYNEPGASVTIQNGSTLTENRGFSGEGGGVYNSHGEVTVDNSTINDNSASKKGGGIYSTGLSPSLPAATVTLRNGSSVTGNGSKQGGGIFNAERSTVTILSNSSITGNEAGLDSPSGGGVFNDGVVTIENGAISGNTPDDCLDVGGTGCPTA